MENRLDPCEAKACCLNKDGCCVDGMSNSSPNICEWGATNPWALPDPDESYDEIEWGD